MEAKLSTYYLRRYINEVVASTETSPSLAELVEHHLDVGFRRQSRSPFHAWYEVHDPHERWLMLRVTDARGYPDTVYQRGQALLRIGVNGALASPADEEFAHQVFGSPVFKTCRHCGYGATGWLDYYGHLKLAHWESQQELG